MHNNNYHTCVLQVFYSFNFWLMFRQQLKERKEAQSLKAESLDEVKVVPRNILLIYFNNCCVTRYHYVLEYYSNTLLPLLIFSTAAEENRPSPLVAMLISGVKGLLVKYWILFCCSMFFVISFSGKVSINWSKSSQGRVYWKNPTCDNGWIGPSLTSLQDNARYSPTACSLHC